MNMDLNRNGLDAMRPIADQAKADAKVINIRLDAAISALSKAGTALTGASIRSKRKYLRELENIYRQSR